jgi:hypothetical protein
MPCRVVVRPMLPDGRVMSAPSRAPKHRTIRRSVGRNAIPVLVPIERRDWNEAVDANRHVHDVVCDCGIVHGEREIVPASPSIRSGVVDVIALLGRRDADTTRDLVRGSPGCRDPSSCFGGWLQSAAASPRARLERHLLVGDPQFLRQHRQWRVGRPESQTAHER